MPVGNPPLDATQNTSATSSDGWGVALQVRSTRTLARRDNHLIVGASFDGARSRYEASTELALLEADRGTAGAGILDAGAAVRLRAEVEHAGLWVADFWTVAPRLRQPRRPLPPAQRVRRRPAARAGGGAHLGGRRARPDALGGVVDGGHTTNRDDILFVSSGALTNEGPFENVGDTARRGLEASASGDVTRGLRWSAPYSRLDAEFRSPLSLSSPNHPDAVNGEIAVASGDALPGVPRHQLKAQLAWSGARAAATLGGAYSSERSLRGDEANLLEPIDSFTTVDLSLSWVVREGIALAARVANLLDEDYETFGLLGEADEVLGEGFEDPRFLGPGAPFGAWIGVEVDWKQR